METAYPEIGARTSINPVAAAAAATATAAASSSQTSPSSSAPPRENGYARTPTKVKVVVIGAGVAGLTAAAKLVHNGMEADVIVLEAQDYVGGRVKAEMCGSDRLDMGAMFVHGQRENPVYRIVEALGVVIEGDHDEDLVNRPDYFYASNRQKIPLREVESFIDFIGDSLVDVDTSATEDCLSKEEALDRCYDQFLEEHQGSVDQNKRQVYDAVYKWYCFYEKLDEGTDLLHDVSAWAVLDRYIKLRGNLYTCIKGGYTPFINAMRELIPESSIRLNTPVVGIDWDQDELSDDKVLVTCANGDVISADHVITTMSLGCLKANHSSLFHPPLPSPFLQTLDRIDLGCVGKIYMQWDEPVLEHTMEAFGYEFLWLKSHPVSVTKDTSKKKTNMGTYWWQDVIGCETVSEHPNVLLFWLLPYQIEIVNQLDDSEIKDVLFEVLQTFIFDQDIPEPKAIYRSKWDQNPYVRGGYSHARCSLQPSDEKHLTLPIPSTQDPRLLFAGEAFSLEYITTVHGAFITGERQADKVLLANDVTDTVSVVDVACARARAKE